jgi:hypothetical protein
MTSNYSTAHLTFTEVVRAGYQRPGVILNTYLDGKEQNTISAGFLAVQRNELSRANQIPFLSLEDAEDTLPPWFAKYRPDCIIGDGSNVHEALTKAGIRVPEDVAFAAFDHEPGLAGARHHDEEVGATAVDMLIGQLHRGEKGIPERRKAVTIESTWESGPTLPVRSSVSVHPGEHESWQNRFKLAGEATADRFAIVDLSRETNRRMSNFDGPFFPLLHFAPGRKTIHGVPFLILDDEAREGSVIAVSAKPSAQPRAHTSREVVIPVRKRVNALYFLHCALYVPEGKEFGCYELVEESGKRTQVPLIPYGRGKHGQKRDPVLNRAATVQDWWPWATVVESKNVKPVFLHKPGDPDLYSRWLYTLEWQAPEREGRELRSICVKATGQTNATVMLLAITALTP